MKKQQTFIQGNKSEQTPANVDRLSNEKGKDVKTKLKDAKKSRKPKNGTEKTTEAQCLRCLDPSHPKRQCPARESKSKESE